MANTLLVNFILICVLNKISSSYIQPSLSEYLLSTLGPQATLPPRPNYQNYGPSYPNYGQTYQNPVPYNPTYQAKPKPTPNAVPPLTAVTNLAATIPDSKIKPPAIPKIPEIPKSKLDSQVLNNLAIALQLLIVSNILNTPCDNQNEFNLSNFDLGSKFETLPIPPLRPLQSASYAIEAPIQKVFTQENLLPNSKFLSSSSYVEPSMLSSLSSVIPRSNSRSSLTLMSPYDALASSPFSDPVTSLLSPTYSKNDFQSPYASILAADASKDMFSFANLF